MKARKAAIVLTLIASAARAASALDAVPSGYRQVAAEYAIPLRLFYAVALTESGKQVNGSPQFRPWPWTLNIRGEAHYFARRNVAEAALRRALAGGEDLIDVGLMQVNWRYHRQHLRSPTSALDPYRNLRIAARILRDCQQEHANWWEAVGCYHAPADRARASRYRERVHYHWLQSSSQPVVP